MKHEIKTLKNTVNVMQYNITAAEQQIAKYDEEAAKKQTAHRKREMGKLDKELDKERLKKRRFQETSKENEAQLSSMLVNAKTKLTDASASRDAMVVSVLGILKIPELG